MQEIYQSATAIGLMLGPFVDATDGVTPETGIDVATADTAKIYKHGASDSITLATATFTHFGSGWYYLMATSTMFDTLGQATIIVQDADVCLPVWKDVMVVHDNYWNWKYGTTNPDVGTVTGGVQGTVASVSIVTGDISGSVTGVTNTLDVGTVTGAVQGTVASVSALGIHDVGTVTGGVTGDITGSVSSVTNFTHTLDVGTVTGAVQGTVASVSIVTGDISGSVSSVTNFSKTLDVGTVTGAVNGDLAGSVTSVTNFTHTLDVGTVTGVVASLSVSAYVYDIASIADGVWDEARSGHKTTGTFGLDMAKGIPKNEPYSDLMFLMVDSTDHRTPKTGLTVQPYVSKDGAAYASCCSSVAEISNGIYQYDATSADMNASMLMFRMNASGADDTFFSIITN